MRLLIEARRDSQPFWWCLNFSISGGPPAAILDLPMDIKKLDFIFRAQKYVNKLMIAPSFASFISWQISG
jgi:hypothetical protein